MKRLIAALALLYLLISLPGCARKALSYEEYSRVRAALVVGAPEVGYYNLRYYLLQKCFILNWSRKYRRDFFKMARRTCKNNGVSLKSFDRAHKKYGLLGLSYSEEIQMHLDTLVKYRWDIVHNYIKGKGFWAGREPLSYPYLLVDLGINPVFLVELDSQGRIYRGSKQVTNKRLIKEFYLFLGKKDKYGPHWGAEGMFLESSPALSTKEVLGIAEKFPGELFIKIGTNLGDDFLIVEIKGTDHDSCLAAGYEPPPSKAYWPRPKPPLLMRVKYFFSDLFNPPEELYEREERSSTLRSGSLPPKELDPEVTRRQKELLSYFDPRYPEIGAYVRVDADGGLYLNSQPVSSSEDLIQKLDYLYKRGPDDMLIALDDRLPWGTAVGVIRKLEESDDEPLLMLVSDLEGAEPQIQTHRIIEWFEADSKD